MAQAHARDRARHAGGLERVVPGRRARLDVAEAAAPRAGVAEDHEGRGAALPALADVRARGLLTDRVQVLRADQRAELAVALAARRRHLEPRAACARAAVAPRRRAPAARPCRPACCASSSPSCSCRRTADASASPHVRRAQLLRRRPRAARSSCLARSARARVQRKRSSDGAADAGCSRAVARSRAIEVIATPASPQGTIQENGSRSLSTLTAKPCVATPRETCTPIEAILRSPTQTPGVVGALRGARARRDAFVGERRDERGLDRCARAPTTSSTRMIG